MTIQDYLHSHGLSVSDLTHEEFKMMVDEIVTINDGGSVGTSILDTIKVRKRHLRN